MKKTIFGLSILCSIVFLTGCSITIDTGKGKKIEATNEDVAIVKMTSTETPVKTEESPSVDEVVYDDLIGVIMSGKIEVLDVKQKKKISTILLSNISVGDKRGTAFVKNKIQHFNASGSIYVVDTGNKLFEINIDGNIKAIKELSNLYGPEYKETFSQYYIDSKNGTMATSYHNFDKYINEVMLYDIQKDKKIVMEIEKYRVICCWNLDDYKLTLPVTYNDNNMHIGEKVLTLNFEENTIDEESYRDYYLMATIEQSEGILINRDIALDEDFGGYALVFSENKTHIYSRFFDKFGWLSHEYIDDKLLDQGHFLGWIDDDSYLLESGNNALFFDVTE